MNGLWKNYWANSMNTFPRYTQYIKQNGVKSYLSSLFRLSDAKVGTLVGKDRLGNQ